MAGHIYVDQPQVRWQNSGYFNALILRFALENKITKFDFIRVVTPKDFGSCSGSTLAQGATAITATCTSTGAVHYVQPSIELSAGTWYTLTLSQGSGTGEAAGIQAIPIKISTVAASAASTGDDGQIVYDENNSAGQFALDAAPGTELSVQLSHIKTQVQAPQDYTTGTPAVAVYKKLATSYTVYIDVKPKFDYVDGAYIKIITADNSYIFTGSCSSDANTCVGVGQTGYQASCVNTTLDSGACTIDSTTGSVGQSFTLEFKGAVLKSNWHRIKATVQNPSLFTTTSGSVNAQIYSRQKDTYKLYEVKTGGIGAQFSLDKISVTDKAVLYFWGLREANLDTAWGCPVGLYKSAKTAGTATFAAINTASKLVIWNKVQVHFKVETAFPSIPSTSTATYKVTLNAAQSEVIPLGSINTNLAAASGMVSCVTTGTKPALTIECDKLAPAAAQIYYITFANFMQQEVTAPTTFGQVKFLQGGVEITSGSNGITPKVIVNDEFLGGYATLWTATNIGIGNQVFDWTEAATDNDAGYKTPVALMWTAVASGRSGIKFPAAAGTALLFLIQPDVDQLCCKGADADSTTKSANCWKADLSGRAKPGGKCDAADGTLADSVLLRLYANANVFDFSSADYKNAGIKKFKNAGFLLSAKDITLCDGTGGCGQYLSANIKDIAAQTTAKWYNIWQIEAGTTANDVASQQFAHLAYTCVNFAKSATATLANVNCVVQVAAAAAATYPGFSMPTIKVQSSFRGNPLYPSSFELDFILCFRYKAQGGAADITDQPFIIKGATGTMAEGLLASTGVLQSQIFNGGLNAATKFRINVVNIGKKTGYNVGAVLPQLLRVGGNINAADHSSNAGIIVFLDANVDGAALYDSGSISACWSAIDTAVSCFTQNTANLAQQLYFYSEAMNRIVILSAVAAGTEFNNYVISQAKETLNGVNLALVNKDSTGNNFDVVRHYPIFGYIFEKQAHTLYNSANTNGVWADQANDYTGLNTMNVLAAAVEKSCALAAGTLALSSGTLYLYSGVSTTLGQVDVTLASCTANNLENTFAISNTDDAGRASQGLWGTHFQVSSQNTKYWSKGDLTWGQTRAADPTNKCVQIAWKQPVATDTRQKYGIVCPVDSNDGTATLDFTNKYLKFAQFEVPFYIGTKAAPGLQELGFIWTGNAGTVLIYKVQQEATTALGQDANSGAKCTLNDISGYSYKGVAQKLQVKATTTLSVVLSPVPTGNDRSQNKLTILLTTTSIGSAALLNGICFTNVDATCSAATWTFTLTKSPPSGANTFTPVTITGEIQLNFWVKTTDSAQTTGGTYSAAIKYVNQNVGLLAAGAPAAADINTCNPTTANKWESANSVYNAAVDSVKLDFEKLSGAQSWFSVSWNINKPWLDFSKFEVTTFLNTASTNTVGKNTKCNLYQGSSFDYSFNTLTDASFAKLVLKPKANLASTVGYELAGQSFKVLCRGSIGPSTALTVSDRVQVNYMIATDTIAFGYDVGFKSGGTDPADRSPLETLTTPATDAAASTVKYSIASSDVTKTWNDQGQEAIYTFNLKVTKADPSVAAGIWIIVEFTRAIPPRLNAKGKLYCEAGFNTTLSQTHCEFDADRRVKILSNIELKNTTNAPTGYLFKVYGVEQPDAFLSSYKSIYFAIASSGSIVYQALIDDKDIGTAAPAILDVLAYSVNTNWTRSTGTFNIDLRLPQGQVANNIDFFVLFPGDFDDAFYKGFSPSCSLTRRLPDWSGFDSTNFIDNCTYDNARRVRLFFKVDSANANAAWFYRLSINSVPTPLTPSQGWSYPTVIVPTLAAGTIAGKKTVSGSQNTSYYGFGDDSTKTYIKWQESVVYAKIGVYSGTATLLPVKGDKFLEAITLTTTATASFVFQPTTFSITSGLQSLQFRFAPKSTTKAGLQFLEFTTTTSGYAPILPLRVVVTPDKCTVNNDATYKFPYGKGAQSLPYVIDFSGCQPESSVKLKIYALNKTATGLSDLNKNFDTTNFTIDGSGTSKEFEVKAGGVPQVSFVVASTDQTVSEASAVGKLVFEFSASTNQASYAISNVVGTVDSVKPDLIGATLTWSVTSASKADQAAKKITYATVSYTCDKPSTFYYAVSTDNATVSGLSFTAIKAKSFDLGNIQTWPEGDKYTIYGYDIDRTGGSARSLTINRLKAGAMYFGYGVCVTAAGASSINTTSSKLANWNQTDNDGKPAVTGLTYDQPLNDAQIKSTCSAFSNALGIPCNRTVCPNSDLACAAATASATTDTNSSSTNKTTRRRRQLQTVINCSIANCTTCATNTTCGACSTGQYVNVDLKSCVTSCPANSEIISGVCTTISSVTELFYVANPDIFAGADTTSTTVSSGLAASDFNTLFLKNANLGTVKFQKYTVYSYSGTPAAGTPTIVASYSGQTDTTVLFKAALNQTDGFVFFGIAEGTPAKPTLDQLKMKALVNGTLVQGYAVFVKNGNSFNQTLRSLKLGTTYTGYYVGQNVYPDLKTGGATDVSSQEFKTTGTSTATTTFASSISTGFFALLALLFALFILI